jgi:hypothetical protein
MRVDEYISLPRCTGSTIVTPKPSASPIRLSSAASPCRRWPNDAEPGDQHLANEIFGAQRSEFTAEMEIIEIGDTEAAEQPGLDAEGGQAEGRGGGLEDAARMRLEGEDGGRRAGLTRQGAGPGDDELMAEMNAVEIADRNGTAARARRKPGIMAEDLHRSPDYRPALPRSEKNIAPHRRRHARRGPAPAPGPRRRSPPCRRRCIRS